MNLKYMNQRINHLYFTPRQCIIYHMLRFTIFYACFEKTVLAYIHFSVLKTKNRKANEELALTFGTEKTMRNMNINYLHTGQISNQIQLILLYFTSRCFFSSTGLVSMVSNIFLRFYIIFWHVISPRIQ